MEHKNEIPKELRSCCWIGCLSLEDSLEFSADAWVVSAFQHVCMKADCVFQSCLSEKWVLPRIIEVETAIPVIEWSVDDGVR